MIKRCQRSIALVVTFAFLTLLLISSMPLPAAQALSQDENVLEGAGHAANFIEKAQQVGYQAKKKNILPIILGVAAVGVGIFLLVKLLAAVKYDVSGVWDFHNDYTTAGSTDYDSIWTFTPYESFDKKSGRFERNIKGTISKGRYYFVDTKIVIFQNADVSEQYVGSFASKTTMSGTFQHTSGAKGNWTAKKK
ncbi:MAG: hypothetical protein MUP71_04880 [Candidatus Aminicenantes bacterium]|nr:hypothetical protein [Candidatus Aminicenantes bacterium]